MILYNSKELLFCVGIMVFEVEILKRIFISFFFFWNFSFGICPNKRPKKFLGHRPDRFNKHRQLGPEIFVYVKNISPKV